MNATQRPRAPARDTPLVEAAAARESAAEGDTLDGTVHDRPIGAILRQAGKLTTTQTEQVLARQREAGQRFGEAAIALRFLQADDVLWALSQQFHYPYRAPEPTARLRELIVAAEPFGEQAEAFRELRSQLLMGVLAGDGPRRAVAVASPNVGDGKTFIAANLAVAFSQLGAHTLLIDIDLRTPRQHDVFGIGRSGGLSNILSGRSEANVIRPVRELPSLFVLPVGGVPPNPLELLQRPAFTMLMQELLLKFDHVVVDTSADSHGADARVVAAACGAVLTVGRQGKSSLRALHKLVAALAQGPAKLAGVVVNDH